MMSNFLDILWDKGVDGAFIFIGIFFAFFFNQCQDDRRAKRELNFNLTQIMRELPKNLPETKIKKFNFVQAAEKNGLCITGLGQMRVRPKNGHRHLNVILNRGLSVYLDKDDSHIIGLIAFYYDRAFAQTIEYRKAFTKKAFEELTKIDDKCLTAGELDKRSAKVRDAYSLYKLSEAETQVVGYTIHNYLKNLGIEAHFEEKKLDTGIEITIEN